ncbi:MAG: aryl-sulfate sulfotransferase [Clostridiales bacterium]|nr:aryl-sulfate sulfotransferase [Clostridiales bacterium]
MGHPSVYPTGTTIYDNDKAWNGYTIFPSVKGALLIDMNGREVNLWAGLSGFPNKIIPGGYVIGSSGAHTGKKSYQDQRDLIQVDFDGNVVWKFVNTEQIDGEWVARQHHDFQREGSPVGYFAPGQEPLVSGKTLLLTHENVINKDISDVELLDDKVVESDEQGNILWSWRASDHFYEFGFNDDAKRVLRQNPNITGPAGGDWLHINSMSALGPNKRYDDGDERFHPDNLILDSRNANILFIVSKQTGRVVWRLGPDFSESEEGKIGWIIGQHHFHLIPQGLPGEGDFLVFDNGGAGGYGLPNASSKDGRNNVIRDHSRILQFDPITLNVTWQYTHSEAGHSFLDASKFYSSFISSAQRLPNGNTLITEGADGRLLEVSPEHDIVWEYINPYYHEFFGGFRSNMVYRAYRAPYEWVPQLERPAETSIAPVDVSAFRVKCAAPGGGRIAEVDGISVDRKALTGMSDVSESEVAKDDFCIVK